MTHNPVLYVEDEEYDVLFMRRAFTKASIAQELHVVDDGQKAIDYLQTVQAEASGLPALVLLDLNLPLISGFEVLRWIRSQQAFSTMPSVIFSSSARPEDRARATLLGANDYIQKPASALDFVSVAQVLQTRWLTLPTVTAIAQAYLARPDGA
jgi:two-component system response regulator